jgi:hypothetical protein
LALCALTRHRFDGFLRRAAEHPRETRISILDARHGHRNLAQREEHGEGELPGHGTSHRLKEKLNPPEP